MRSKLFHAIVLVGSSLVAGACNRDRPVTPPDAAADASASSDLSAAPVDDLATADFYGLCPQCNSVLCPDKADLSANPLPCCHTPAPECNCYPCFI